MTPAPAPARADQNAGERGATGLILCLETATAVCSAALFDGERLVAESLPVEGKAHAQLLLAGAHEVLQAAGAEARELDAVVASLGPGAYTGLRIGVATVRALAQATGCRLAGVPTLEALALGLATGELGASARYVVPLIDGRRRELFAACYELVGDPSTRDPAGAPAFAALREVAPLSVVPADELAGFLERYPGAVTGGDGAVLYADRLPTSVVRDPEVSAPTAAQVGRAWLGGAAGAAEGFAAVLPLYGRLPDAARWPAGKKPT